MSEIIEYSSLCFLFWFGGPSALSSSHIQALGLVAVTGRSEQLSCHSQTARSQPRGRVAACNQGSSAARPVPAVAKEAVGGSATTANIQWVCTGRTGKGRQ